MPFTTIRANTGITANTSGTFATGLVNSTTVSFVTSSRALGTVYQNTTGKHLLVISTIEQTTTAYTVFGNLSAVSGGLPSITGGSNGNTVTGSSFGVATGCVNLTWVVPPGYYYNVTTNQPNTAVLILSFWTEYTLPF